MTPCLHGTSTNRQSFQTWPGLPRSCPQKAKPSSKNNLDLPNSHSSLHIYIYIYIYTHYFGVEGHCDGFLGGPGRVLSHKPLQAPKKTRRRYVCQKRALVPLSGTEILRKHIRQTLLPTGYLRVSRILVEDAALPRTVSKL